MVIADNNIQLLTSMVVGYLPKIAGATLTLVVGWMAINFVLKSGFKLMERKEVEPSLRTFLQSFLGFVLKATLLVSVATMLGLKTTSFVAALGAAGLAVGLALQGSLSNFAGGVLILLFRPFRVGDFIEAQGYIGKVRQITIFNSIIVTPDSKTVFIPNGSLANGALTNYTESPLRRLDLVFGVSYTDDIDKVKDVIGQVLDTVPTILPDPEPVIAVQALADNSVNFTVRPWVKNEDYLTTSFQLQEGVKKAFDQNDISIPFPQRDIHLYKSN